MPSDKKKIEKGMDDIWKTLFGMSKGRLEEYKQEVVDYGTDNCFWVYYHAKDFLLDLISDRLLNIERLKKETKK